MPTYQSFFGGSNHTFRVFFLGGGVMTPGTFPSQDPPLSSTIRLKHSGQEMDIAIKLLWISHIPDQYVMVNIFNFIYPLTKL